MGCISTHYDGDDIDHDGYNTVNGYAPDSGYVTVKLWDFVDSEWDTMTSVTYGGVTYPYTVPTWDFADLYYRTNDLFGFEWRYPPAAAISSRYKQGGFIRAQFSQGGTTFYVFDSALNTFDPSAVSPEICIAAILDPFGTGGYTIPTDWSHTSTTTTIITQSIFTRCGGSSLKALNLRL
ncbi:MAG: hypothetical protein R3B40_10610 [Polyangiales bacterium]|nr:hypothetical protein [Sandaracinaceae bacterium]